MEPKKRRGRPKKVVAPIPIESVPFADVSLSPSAQAAPLPFKASIKIFGVLHEAIGETVAEAISNLKVGKAGGICVLRISRGEVTQEKIVPSRSLWQLFNGGRMMKEIALKQLVMRYDFK